jgi:hypothetical protein
MNRLLLLLLLAAGCTTRELTRKPDGTLIYKSKRFANKESIGEVNISTNNMSMKNFQSDQVQAVGVIAEGVAKGVASGLKP